MAEPLDARLDVVGNLGLCTGSLVYMETYRTFAKRLYTIKECPGHVVGPTVITVCDTPR